MRLKQKIKLLLINNYTNFLLLNQGIQIKKVSTEEELNQARQLAWEIYAVKKRYIDPNFFQSRMFTDEFDEHSIYFLALNRGKLIGTVRLVLNSEKGFPIERVYRLIPTGIDKNKIAEISRLITIDEVPRKDIVALSLCKECFKESLHFRIEYWYAFLPERLKNHFEKKYNIPFIELKYLPPTYREEQSRHPYRFYFSKFRPKPYLIPLQKTLESFKI